MKNMHRYILCKSLKCNDSAKIRTYENSFSFIRSFPFQNGYIMTIWIRLFGNKRDMREREERENKFFLLLISFLNATYSTFNAFIYIRTR